MKASHLYEALSIGLFLSSYKYFEVGVHAGTTVADVKQDNRLSARYLL